MLALKMPGSFRVCAFQLQRVKILEPVVISSEEEAGRATAMEEEEPQNVLEITPDDGDNTQFEDAQKVQIFYFYARLLSVVDRPCM